MVLSSIKESINYFIILKSSRLCYLFIKISLFLELKKQWNGVHYLNITVLGIYILHFKSYLANISK